MESSHFTSIIGGKKVDREGVRMAGLESKEGGKRGQRWNDGGQV